jgi:hypothetical protein
MMLKQEVEQLRAAQGQISSTNAGRVGAATGMTGMPMAMPDLDATLDELKVAKSEEVAGLREEREGQRKKLAAAVTYTRVYQNLEALQASRPGDVEPVLVDVMERMVELRSELDPRQLHTALEKEQLLPEGQWPQEPPPSTRSPSVGHVSPQSRAAPSSTPLPPAAAMSSRASQLSTDTKATTVDLFAESMSILKGAKEYDPERKRDAFATGIEMMERALKSGGLKAAVKPQAEKALAQFQQKKVQLDAQVLELSRA